jgi:hypothetical protein
LLPKINEAGNDYTTISSFKHNGVTYPVTYIGSAAYHFTYIIAQNITISDGVDKIGAYAFYSKMDASKKYCITFDLNNVVKAGKFAFYYMDMVKLVGDALEEVGDNTISYNQNLLVANLPNLLRSRPAGSTEPKASVFIACSKLRLAYVGFSDDIAYDKSDSLRKNYIRFINYVGDSKKIEVPKVNTVVNNSLPTVDVSFRNSFIKTNQSFSGIYASDYYEYKVVLEEITGVIELPGYIYQVKDNGELSLIAVSPDIQMFGDYKINANGGTDYTTPRKLYLDGSEYTVKDNGTEAIFTVTSFGNHAYGAVSISGIDNFIVADTITALSDGALSGSAFENSNSSIVTLSDVKCLDLANVTTLGYQACKGAKIKNLKAPNAEIFGVEAFLNCTSLGSAYLPSFVKSLERDTFRNCSSLIEVTLGEKTEALANNMFDSANNLTKITILNSTSVVTTGVNLRTSNPDKIIIAVPAAIYDAYKAIYTNKDFAKIPFKNFQKFGASSMVNGLTYYWNVLSEADKTAYIDYVEGTLPTTLNFPSEIGGYKVVSVSKDTIAALSGVTKIKLPDNMEYLEFDTSDLASTIREIEISTSNAKFKTANGVLYSKDGKILYIYPKAKLATAFTVESSVTEIAYRAFYNAKNIETLTIAGVVTVRDQAFESVGISTIKFTSSTASVFAGRDIFLGANTLLKISVPNASLGAFKSNVLIDYSILDKFIGA